MKAPPASRFPRRSGLGLVEVCLFGALGLFLISVTWAALSSSARGGREVEGKAQALEATLLASAWLQRDLNSLAEGPGALLRAEVGIAGTDLSVPILRPGAEQAQAIQYHFDPVDGHLIRQAPGEDPRKLPGTLASFLVRTTGEVGIEGPCLLYTMVGRGQTSDLPGDRSIVYGGVPREHLAASRNFPGWNPVALPIETNEDPS